MKTYKINLEIYSGILTPLQADTIFGHLCWVVAYQEGEEGLQQFLEPFKRNDPPFVISDGFPYDLLPKPLSAEFNIDDPQERKELKKIEFIDLKDFDFLREGKKYKPEVPATPFASFVTPHNTVSRLTNSTLIEGGVYSLEEAFIPNITLYFKAVSDEWKNRVVELFNELSKSGYGRKKSIGKGQFSVIEVNDFNFTPIEKADGFVALSNFCPGKNDPTDGLYKTFVKYGKLGEEFTFCGNPFKRPLLMIKAGSVFKTIGEPREFYGRLVQNGIAPAKPEVVHYAYCFSIPVVYPQM